MKSLSTVDSDEEEHFEPIKRTRKLKRIIQDSSSSGEDEDDIPLIQRKAAQKKLVVPETPPAKKVKLSSQEQFESPKSIFKLNAKTRNQSNNIYGLLSKSRMHNNSIDKQPSKPPPKANIEKPIQKDIQATEKPVSNNPIPPPFSNVFKASMAPPLNGFKTPISPSPNEFKAPTPPSSNEFKASMAPSPSNGLKVPMIPSTPSNDMNMGFTETQKNELITNRLSHYITCICQDLDQYNQTKKRQADSFLTFSDDDLPMLDISVMQKFTTMISHTVRHNQTLDGIDMNKFGKIIKLMENTVIASTEIDAIEYYAKNTTQDRKALCMLTTISDAFEACCMIFEIVTTCKLDKKFISHNLITNCLHFIKNQLDYTIYPLLDLNDAQDESMSLTPNALVFLKLVQSSPQDKRLLSTFIPSMIRFFRRAYSLITMQDLDDDVLVIVAYISMGPFFHDTSDPQSILLQIRQDENKFNPYEQLKFYALDMLKHIFSKYPKHRRWIFEEILTSLGSLTVMDGTRKYRLRDNRTIHVISALFMQLVQCSASISDISSHKNWYKKFNIKYQKMLKNNDTDQLKMLDDKLIRRASVTWRQSTEAATNSASFFLEFLMSKCKSKKSDTYSLQEYRLILEQTLQDIMTVLNDPDWPVAELIVRVFSRILISLLEGTSSDQYLKSLAVEWLGIIASKIKTGYKKLSGDYTSYTPEWLFDLNEKLPFQITMEIDIGSIFLLDQCRKKLLDHVIAERASQNVISFYLCNWGFIESVVWTKANKGWEIEEKRKLPQNIEEKDDTLMNTTPVKEDEAIELKWPRETAMLLEDTCKYYWLSCLGMEHPFPKSQPQHEFPEMARSDYALLTELLASRQTLYTSYKFILSEILACLEKDAVVYRTKALKAIGKIAVEVPEILEDKRISKVVVQRVHDTSPSVRDAAIDVLAKYLHRSSTVPDQLYQVISSRIMDTAINVRKRVVKLLSGLYFKFTDPEVKMNIASKLIQRIGDNEVTISQLALKVTQDILFVPFKEIEKDGNDYFGYSFANSPKQRKHKINELTHIIIGAVAKLDPSIAGQNAALSQITMDEADEKASVWYNKVFQWIVDSLFERMILLDEQDKMTEFNHSLITVYSFTKSCPNLLRESHVSMLQPYLSVSENADWTRARYVLTIYRDALPLMKHHNPDFIQSIERVLMRLLGCCPLGLIPSGISCLCVIVDKISHRYNILIKMLGSCITKLNQVRQLITEGQTEDSRIFGGILKMLMICGLLCQNFEFDKKREQYPQEMEALNMVYRGDIGILVFDLLRFFTSEYMDELSNDGISMRMTALQGLGYFYASHPTFMISDESTRLMDKIFNEGTTKIKTQLMMVFQEFLMAEEKRIGKREQEAGSSLFTKDIDVDTLLGNTEEYAELGVNGSLMQRYLRKILDCALAGLDELRYAAFEVVSAIVHQGLANPVFCMSAIVAAETSPDAILRNKAYYLHRYAHDKYGTLLYIQMNEYLMASFQYQQMLAQDQQVVVCGYSHRGGDAKVDSVLGLTFSILKDKKKLKFDFLAALIKPFDFDLKKTADEDIDIGYMKYLGENLVAMDLATADEVLYIVYLMDRILITLGADLLSYVHFLQKQDILVPVSEEDNDEPVTDIDFMVASKLSVVMCILLYVKTLLIEVYDIPDE
ncbi:Sister chromatid cohesion protein 2 [Rhizopus stolonifer]|uniref:Sister chromatid cohesion protein n=1 Tax=Rhizopus stolonifer TaxID=4846 RepID=A0A367KIW9_RHIST|nr:Sister chromatid cohesion protein 2 [Rhizopus stolonifer]